MKSLIRSHCKMLILILCALVQKSNAQESAAKKTAGQKAVKTTEKISQKSMEIQQESALMNQNMQTAGVQVKSTVQNVKSIIKIFEPILRLRLKKSSNSMDAPNPNSEVTETLQEPTESLEATDAEDIVQESPEEAILVPESSEYNVDGTANLGNQNHKQYGCYIDIMQGQVMDDIDAAGNTSKVDLIFTATDYFGSAPMYALLTPSYVKQDNFSNYYFRGSNFKDANIPVKQWDELNESEIALTSLTAEKFEKIQNNNQLMAVIKQISGFKDKFESRTKINGKVFAIKTEMGNRQAYGLLLITDQFGTTGTNGYLKIKLKVTGFDANGDGNPDANLYK
ncbi:MAG: hypothetical protein IPO78_14900 [Saprospiraceae bacterium]|nr:hypothetical protein [Saprospiraceae bacterium]MBK9722883.1 hypothetical protein [Saprospiraceae bacterium]